MSRLVTVIMPVYDGEGFIAEAIQSIIAQTHTYWELIVVDDGSTDNTSGVVKVFEDPRIRYTYQENRGQAAALNRGLEMARGQYITTLDADDLMTRHSLGDRAQYLDRMPEFGAVYGDGYYCDLSGKPLIRFSEYRSTNAIGDIYNVLILSSFFGTGSPVMIRRSIIEKYDLRYDESIDWCQDWEFYIRLAERTNFGSVDSITVFYRLHDNNMTIAMPTNQRLESLIRTKLKVLDSPRFDKAPDSTKSDFFYYILVVDLYKQLEMQDQLINKPQFRTLPSHEQSRLLRLMAIEYLLKDENLDVVQKWLRSALSLAPLNAKNILVTLLSMFNLNIAKTVVKTWRNLKVKTMKPSSFEMILNSGRSNR